MKTSDMFTKKTIEIWLSVSSISGFPKVGQVAPQGAMTDTQGAMSSKGATGGP